MFLWENTKITEVVEKPRECRTSFGGTMTDKPNWEEKIEKLTLKWVEDLRKRDDYNEDDMKSILVEFRKACIAALKEMEHKGIGFFVIGCTRCHLRPVDTCFKESHYCRYCRSEIARENRNSASGAGNDLSCRYL